MGKRGTVTLPEILVVVALLLVAVAVLVLVFGSRRSDAQRTGCQGNLNQLVKALWVYQNECGDSRFPWPAGRPGCGTRANPRFGGAEWLAALYWTKLMPDPGVFVCPAALDSNQDGKELGADGCPGNKPLPAHAVSYAAMGDISWGTLVANYGAYFDGDTLERRPSYATSKLQVPHDDHIPLKQPMACDDTEEPINHGSAGNGGMNVLFFDSHVEWWTHDRVDLERGVGTGELVHLRN